MRIFCPYCDQEVNDTDMVRFQDDLMCVACAELEVLGSREEEESLDELDFE